MATQYNQGRYSYRRRRRRGKPKRFSRKMCITVFLVFCVCLFTFGVLLFKIYRINSKDGDRYRKEALSQQSYTNTVLNYQRGDVKDRNNTTLAVSVRKYDLVLEPRTLGKDEKKKQATVDAIAKTFGVASSVVEEVIQKKPNSMYEHIDGLKELPAKNRPHGRPGGDSPARLCPDPAPGRRQKNHPPVSVGKDRRQPGFSDERQLL